MVHLILNRIIKLKFKTKILCIVGTVASIPALLLLFVYYCQIRALHSREIDNIKLSFDQQTSYINQQMEQATSSLIKISTNTRISQFFSLQESRSEYLIEYIKSIRPFLTYIQSTEGPEMNAIRFYTRNQNLFSNLTIQNIYKNNNIEFFEEISSLLDANGTLVRLSPEGRSYYYTEYSAEGTLSVFAPILTPSEEKTFVEYELSFDNIYQALQNVTNDFETTGYTLFHKSGNIIFTSDSEFANNIQPYMNGISDSLSFESQRRRYEDTVLFINYSYIPSIDCILVSHSDLNTIMEPVRRSQLLNILLILVCIISSCLLAGILVNRLLRRSDIINSAIHQIEGGNFDITLPIRGNDFFDQIADNLNSMALQIKNLIRNNYEKQLQIKNLQIRMFSQQISPHFLYNTLECLKMNAILENRNETAQALTSLGRLLRYYANYSSDFSVIQAELEGVKDYISIMNLIEGRKCFYEETVPEECLSCPIPRFVIQPIVENSIKHGCPSCSSEIHIHLAVRLEDNLLHFTITDDGVGIPPEALEQLRLKLQDSQVSYQYGNQQTSIGLYNTNARIKLIYGSQYGITLADNSGAGSIVSFTIPAFVKERETLHMSHEENSYVQFTDL